MIRVGRPLVLLAHDQPLPDVLPEGAIVERRLPGETVEAAMERLFTVEPYGLAPVKPEPLFGLLARQSEPRTSAATQEHAPSTLTPRPIR